VYDWNEARGGIEAICAHFALHCEVVTDFPSWIEGAKLVVFTPALGTLKHKSVKTGPEQLSLF
jgi:hypothetical protein